MSAAFVSLTRERAYGQSKASATYTFAIFDRAAKTHAEVILANGGFEIIELRGKDPKVAARLALETTSRCGMWSFVAPIFLRIRYPHAEYFSRHGKFHDSFHRAGDH